MARARILKPQFFKNEDLAQCQPLARLLFQGLWCIADRDGRLEDRPVRIKAEVLPYDNCDVNVLLDELEAHGFIQRYQNDTRRFVQIITFSKHAKPHDNEPSDDFPAPPVRKNKSCKKNSLQNKSRKKTSKSACINSYSLPFDNSLPDSLASIPPDEPAMAEEELPTPKPRNELFDAVAEVTGSAPKTSAKKIGMAVRELKKEDPPFTPEEVRAWARLVQSLHWWEGGPPTITFLIEDINRVRRNDKGPAPPGWQSLKKWEAKGGDEDLVTSAVVANDTS